MKLNISNVVQYAIFAAVIIILLKWGCGQRDALIEQTTLYEVAHDSIQYERGKKDEEIAKRGVLEARNTETLLKLKTKDESIIRLQGLVNRYKGRLRGSGSSATTVTTVTTASGSSDTVFISGDAENPIYAGEVRLVRDTTTWIRAAIRAGRDTIHLDTLVIVNDYDIVIGHEGGFLKKKKPFVEITNHNPYTHTTSFRTFRVTEKKKRFVVSAGVQYGLGNNLLEPNIGIHVGYKLFEF